MANFNFVINTSNTFSVDTTSVIDTDCATQYTYTVNATAGDSIRFSLEGSTLLPVQWRNQGYEILDVNYSDWENDDEKTIVYSSNLIIYFALENSGDSGRFNSATLNINNDTTGESFSVEVQRNNDSAPCSNGGGGSDSFDSLLDTPATKSGNTLKLVRVNAAGTLLEYVDHDDLLPREADVIGIADEDISWTGTENIDLSAVDSGRYILTGNTTLTVSNTPSVGESRPINMMISGDFSLTLPASWVIKGTYDGTVENYFSIVFSNWTTEGDVVFCNIIQA